MKRKRHTPQEIIAKLREAEVDLNQGATIDPSADLSKANLLLRVALDLVERHVADQACLLHQRKRQIVPSLHDNPEPFSNRTPVERIVPFHDDSLLPASNGREPSLHYQRRFGKT